MSNAGSVGDGLSKSLLPRRYQEEVFARAQQENIIAALNTGSGKTLIGLLLIRWISSLDASKGKVIIFLVPKVSLVEQQGTFIAQNTPLRVIKLHGALEIDLTDRARWRKRFANHDVFVMTAQIFLNFLTHSIWSIDKVSLMIFDECHHARKNHPYNGIMREYFQIRDAAHRPKVFGMTASPIWNPKDAIGSLTTLESNMDSKVVGVRTHVEELDEHSPKPVEIIKEYPFPPEEYDCPVSSLWKCLQVFDKTIWAELEIPWTSLEMRYYSTLNNLGPYAASLFLHIELGQHLSRIHDSYLNNLLALDYTMEMELPSQIEVKSPPSDFWEIRQVHVDFGAYFASPLSTYQTPIPVPLTWCTPKVQTVVDILLAYYTPDFQGIVFVEQRQTATCLAMILSAIAELEGSIRCGALMGQGVNSDGVAKLTPGGHKTAVESFRKGDINLLIATSVAEEGLDFPACDLVIRFDPVAHMVGYVQSRGRARNKTSTFIIMMQKDDAAHLSRYTALKAAEPEVKMAYQFRHEIEDDAIEVDSDDDETHPADLVERERYVVPSSGAILTYDNSIQLLHHLCSLIPCDAFTPPHIPKFSGDFQATLVLPSSIPLPPENLSFVGPTRRSKREAKRAVAFMAVKRLHELDVFDEFLLPVARSREAETEDTDGRPLVDVRKVPTVMDVLVADPWTNGPRLWSHLVYIDGQAVAALITGTMLPPVDVLRGTISVRTQPGEPLVLGDADDEPQKRRLMTEFTKYGIWFRITARPFTLPPSLFLVPITSHHQPDFDAMERLVESPRGSSDWSSVTDDDFDNLMIMNTNEFGRPLMLRHIRHDLTPMSPPLPGSREAGFPTYYEYFVNKWTRKKWQPRVPTGGPLLAAVVLPRSYEGRYTLGSEISTPANVELTVANGLVAPQDCCQWVAMSADIRRAFEVLPALCRRITDVYRVRRARLELSLPPIRDNLLVEAFTLPSAEAGFSNQRMETLGDAVLELCTTVHLFNKYPHRHEGQLSVLRQQAISNRHLLRRAKEIGLETYLTSERHSVHVWRYVEEVEKALDPSATRYARRSYPRRSLQDCMEALLGASFITGGIPMALHTGAALGLSFGGPLPWSLRYDRDPVPCPVSSLFVELEENLGYTFHRSELLIEAITHPSFCSSVGGASYQRLEFLGDALLDLVVIQYLYNKFPEATSHQLALPRTKAICATALAWVAVRRLGLHQIMLVNRLDLIEAINTYVPVLQALSGEEIVRRGWKYDPPKPLSDVFESVMGAILVDSGYNYEKTAAVIEHVMEDIVLALSPSVAQDPVTTLVHWMSAFGCSKLSFEKKVKSQGGVEREGVAVLVHGVVIAGPIIATSQSVARFAAAERALVLLQAIDGDKSLSRLCTCRKDKPAGDAGLSGSYEDCVDDSELELQEELEVADALGVSTNLDIGSTCMPCLD
ncbi:putative dicer dimerisation domain containing protein [Lyophyllum shimeji]|uniref:Dicer dimerisation domain containing protein n=1 Tax=Lyophyllum shimeji TaxID=47721 RepID=A0A9P3PGD5_LYOSH|nr:putative dicer dimerisation domain containing protein [Lyophyllum shimeji]